MPKELQKKFSFDSVTQRKILISFGLTALAALGAFMVALSQGVNTQEALLIALGTVGAFIVNTIKEYFSGV